MLVNVGIWITVRTVVIGGRSIRAAIVLVRIGPRGGGEHEVVEGVELVSVERLRDVLLATAQDVCARG